MGVSRTLLLALLVVLLLDPWAVLAGTGYNPFTQTQVTLPDTAATFGLPILSDDPKLKILKSEYACVFRSTLPFQSMVTVTCPGSRKVSG